MENPAVDEAGAIELAVSGMTAPAVPMPYSGCSPACPACRVRVWTSRVLALGSGAMRVRMRSSRRCRLPVMRPSPSRAQAPFRVRGGCGCI